MTEGPPRAAPATQRIEVVDAIRGFAVFGILLGNILAWSGYRFLPFETIAQLPDGQYDATLWRLQLFFIDSKFYAMFSMLFGAGFWLQFRRNRAPDEQPAFMRRYRRRLAFLLGFGALHALLWSGDILMLYALVGFAFIPFRNLSARGQLALALLGLAVFLIPQGLVLWAGPPAPPPLLAHKVYPGIAPSDYVAIFQTGSFSDMFLRNLENVYWRWVDFFPNGRISRVWALFLLGFWLGRTDFFSDRAQRPAWLLGLAIPGLLFTSAALAIGGPMTQWSQDLPHLVAKGCMTVGQVTLALAYVCVVAIAFEREWGRRWLHPLTLIGRMAFTNYLSQTVIGVGLFWGLGLFGSLGLPSIWTLALAIYAGQVVFSSLWLRRFRFGPIEWAWRCLTYGERFPIRRAVPA